MSKLNKDSALGTFVIIITFCLVCSVLVSSAVVALNPFKAAAVANDRQVSILKVSGFEVKGSVADTFNKHIESHLIDVDTGALADDKVNKDEIEGYNFASLAKKPETSVSIPKDKDVAGILTRSKLMPVYFAKNDDGKVEREMTYLAVHGMFHLLGYDHMTEEDKAEMRAKEEEALRAINLSEEYFDHPTGIH